MRRRPAIHRGARVIVLAAMLVVLMAGAAEASFVSASQGALVFDTLPGEQNAVTIVREPDAYRVSDQGVPQLTPGIGCAATGDPRTVTCSAAGVAGITALLNDGDDEIRVSAAVPATITGGTGADRITGGDGDDRLEGQAGGDSVYGGAGNDRMFELDAERNVLDGGPGQDVLSGGSGPDEVYGGAGDDQQLFGGEGDDLIDGGEGNDLLDPGAGPFLSLGDADRLAGGPGLDRVTYDLRGASVRVSLADGPNDGAVGEGDDVLADVEQLSGGQSADQLFGGAADDEIDGRGGADVIEGGGGADRLDGGADDGQGDTLRGGAGADVLVGRAGGDQLEGGDQADVLTGDAGSDRLSGDDGADRLDGGADDDELDGGLGADGLIGGGGQDTVVYSSRRSPVEVTIDGVANDGEVIASPDGRTRTEEPGVGTEGDDVDATNESVTASRADDSVEGDSTANRLAGATGEDFIDGEGGADTLSGGGRNDTIVSRDGARDRVSCGSGYDYVLADRRDLLPRSGSRCEFVDDGSRRTPAPRRDVSVDPRCDAGQDADLSPPRTDRAVPLEDDRALVPVGSRVDSLDCAVALRVGIGRGRARSGRLGEGTGAVRITQRRREGRRVLTRMTATDCPRANAAGVVEATMSRFPRPRYVRRYGRIAFPAEVRIDSAVMRPRGIVTWEADDRCGRGATITVSTGRLAVLDLGTDRRVILGPGDVYTASAP